MPASSSRTIGDFDYIIVGAGSAGCLLANRLSADPQVRVLLLEAGGKDNNIWIKVPLGLFYLIGNPRTDWCYQTEPEPECNGRQIPVPRGRMLGGSSSINGMVYVRGQPRDYDNRASYTLYDSDTKRFEFKRIEYDIETAAEKVLRAKLERNFAHRLYIGV